MYNMKRFLFFTYSILFSLLVCGQGGSFSYDTIRTNRNKQQDVPTYYGAPAFSYDTVRSTNKRSSPRYSANPSPQNNNSHINTEKLSKQSTSSSFDRQKLFFGGNIGLSFGNFTLVDIAPQVGYAFNQYFSAGAGISFTYANSEYTEYEATRTYLGANLFAYIYPIKYIALSVQPGIDYMWASDKYYGGGKFTENKAIPSFVIGGGLRIPTGNVGGMIMMLKYDLVQNPHSPYGNSIFYSVGYVFSF